MNIGTTYRIAQAQDLESIYAYSENKLKEHHSNEMELMMAVWNSRFRKEALEHYLRLGWSFVAHNSESTICGFFLGQPLLFFQGQTQTLWVEYILADNAQLKSELVNLAQQLGRDKHFQQVIFPENVKELEFQKPIVFHKMSEPIVWVKTTK